MRIFDDRQKKKWKGEIEDRRGSREYFYPIRDKYAYHLNKSRQPSRYSTAFETQARYVKLNTPFAKSRDFSSTNK